MVMRFVRVETDSRHPVSVSNSMGHEFTESTTTLIDDSGEQSTEQPAATRSVERGCRDFPTVCVDV